MRFRDYLSHQAARERRRHGSAGRYVSALMWSALAIEVAAIIIRIY